MISRIRRKWRWLNSIVISCKVSQWSNNHILHTSRNFSYRNFSRKCSYIRYKSRGKNSSGISTHSKTMTGKIIINLKSYSWFNIGTRPATRTNPTPGHWAAALILHQPSNNSWTPTLSLGNWSIQERRTKPPTTTPLWVFVLGWSYTTRALMKSINRRCNSLLVILRCKSWGKATPSRTTWWTLIWTSSSNSNSRTMISSTVNPTTFQTIPWSRSNSSNPFSCCITSGETGAGKTRLMTTTIAIRDSLPHRWRRSQCSWRTIPSPWLVWPNLSTYSALIRTIR